MDSVAEVKAGKCPECGTGGLTRLNRGREEVCNTCGLVIDEEVLENVSTLEGFEGELNSVKSWGDICFRDASQGKGTPWEFRVSNSAEKGVAEALRELERADSYLNLPKETKTSAAMLYKKAVRKGAIKGRGGCEVMAACIYAACRITKVPRSLSEVITATGLNRGKILRTCKSIKRDLKIVYSPPDAVEFVYRFVSELKLSKGLQKQSLDILDRVGKEISFGRDPRRDSRGSDIRRVQIDRRDSHATAAGDVLGAD